MSSIKFDPKTELIDCDSIQTYLDLVLLIYTKYEKSVFENINLSSKRDEGIQELKIWKTLTKLGQELFDIQMSSHRIAKIYNSYINDKNKYIEKIAKNKRDKTLPFHEVSFQNYNLEHEISKLELIHENFVNEVFRVRRDLNEIEK